MTEQRIKSRAIPPLRGALLIALILTGLLLASTISQLLARFMPAIIPTAAVWLLTGSFVFFLMRNAIAEYSYIVSGNVLYVERVYGQRTKMLLQLPVQDIVSVGAVDAARAARPELGRALSCTLKDCPIPRRAVIYRAKGVYQWIILQPDERILALLWDEEARRRSRIDKWG